MKVACLLFNAFWAYKNIWMKVASLHFVRVKSFCKKGLKLSLMTSFILLLSIYNKIDYIILNQKKKEVLTNAGSYGGTEKS